MNRIAEQIAAFEQKRAALVAANDEIMTKAAEDGTTLDAEQKEAFDSNEADTKEIDDHLRRLRSMEKAQGEGAKAVDGKSSRGGTDARVPAQIKAPKAVEPGIRFARLAKVKALAGLNHMDVAALAERLYPDDPTIKAIVTKATVPAGSTLSGSWAEDLVGDETSVFADFVEFLRPSTIIGKFGLNGIPSLRNVPFRVALIGQTGGGEGYWVGEGKAKPLTSFDFSRTTLEPLKVANIAVVTEELLRSSSPSAEGILRDSLAAALRQRLDIDFIDPAKTADAGVSPASITNGAETVVSTGDTAAAIVVDVRALFQKFIDANNPPSSGVWIMQSTTALALSMMLNPLGQREFPNIGMMGGTFEGLPVIVSDHVPAGIVAIVNAQDIYVGDEGGVQIDLSREASLEMLDSSLLGSSVPTVATGTTMVSMFQTNSVAFRAERIINWARRRPSAVAYLTSVDWGGAVPPS